MKLSKAMEMLEEDYKLRFRCYGEDSSYSELSCNKNGYINVDIYNSNDQLENGLRGQFNGMIHNDMDWKLIETPMSFEELLKIEELYNKDIKVEFCDIKTDYDSFEVTMDYLVASKNNEQLVKIMKNGRWYVRKKI